MCHMIAVSECMHEHVVIDLLLLNLYTKTVLSADESSLIAMQLDMNPIVDERQALDLYPRYDG